MCGVRCGRGARRLPPMRRLMLMAVKVNTGPPLSALLLLRFSTCDEGKVWVWVWVSEEGKGGGNVFPWRYNAPAVLETLA